jgi:glutathione synthase/RimK-type ligase-like ATP-grasp enzyme
MPSIALLTAGNLMSDAPDRRSDAHLFDIQLDALRQGFAGEGFELRPARWSDPDTDWRTFAGVLIACAWDYQDRHEAFVSALERIRALGTPVFNEPDTVRWNIRKTYLRELQQKGVAVIPTLWPDAPAGEDIGHAMDAFGVEEVVLKRQVGGGARGQARYNRSALPAPGPVLDRPGMIQPFVPAILSEGEYSFLFVDGVFSHALIKRPRAGDYRIQEAYGGVCKGVDPAPADRAAAEAVLDAAGKRPLYARVDMVRAAGGGLMLMELEVIEPYLYPLQGPGIGPVLARALARRLA